MSSRIGLCFGGYCPLHQGHLDLIMQCKKLHDVCVVVVCGYDDEPRANELNIDLNKRFNLVSEFFNDDEQVKVIYINDTEIGLDESMSIHNWEVWYGMVRRILYGKHITSDYDEEITTYVAEPDYVTSLNTIGEHPVLMDKFINISGTLIRKNPLKYWNNIASTFRPYITKNILVIGTASEGKTTLVNDIARYFGCPHTTEFGRDYMAEHCLYDTDLTVEDFKEFIIGQNEYYKAAVKNANNGIMISDTDNLVTLMYAKAYAEDMNINLSEKDYSEILYPIAKSLQSSVKWDRIFVLCPNNKFVDDGTRYMKQSSMNERIANYAKLISLLKDFNLYDKCEFLTGGEYLNNFNTVKDYISSLYE